MSLFRTALPQLLGHGIAPRLAPAAARITASPLANLRAATAASSRQLSTSSRPTLSSIVRTKFQQARQATTGAFPKQAEEEVDWKKVGTSVGIAAAAAFGLHFALNRETRGALSPVESSYLNETFKFTGVGLGITAAVAKLMHENGGAARLMAANPWAVMIGGLVLSVGSMYGVYATAPDSPAHYLSWAVFSAVQGVTLSPLFYINPAILTRAGLYTVGSVGGLAYVGATAQNEQFLWMGGPLLAGLGVLIAANLAPMLMPRMAMRTLSVLEHVGAYGGVAVFSGMILFRTQNILNNARLAERGVIPRDPVRESVGMILSTINLFVSFVRVLLLQQGRRK